MNTELFKELLYAVGNIGGNAEPETDEGILSSQAALLMADRLFPTQDDLRQSLKQGDEFFQEYADTVEISDDVMRSGQIYAVKLWLECMEASDPEAHAKREIEKGLNGLRVDFNDVSNPV